jgi:hypothetical protein
MGGLEKAATLLPSRLFAPQKSRRSRNDFVTVQPGRARQREFP